MSVLFIKINFNQGYILILPRSKVTVVTLFTLLASHMPHTAFLKNLRKTSECDVIFDKHRRQTLAVVLFNLCHVFYIVFVKR